MRRDELPWNFILRNAFASALAVVHAVIKTWRQRILAHRTLGVVGDVINVRWEKTLIRFMHARGDIRPPQKSLRERRAIVGAHFEFDDPPARMQADPVHAFHAAHRIMIAAPDGYCAVGVLFDFKIRGQKSRRAVMLRPVEFNAAGDPRPRQADERGFDDALIVNEIVAVGLVENGVNAPADFGQDHYAEKLVFEPDRFPFSIQSGFGNSIREGQRINLAAAALIDAIFQEHRIFVRRGGKISGDGQFFPTDRDRRRFLPLPSARHGRRSLESRWVFHFPTMT